MAIPFTVVSGAIVITDPTGDIVEIETKSNGTKSMSTTSELSGSDGLAAYRKVNTKVRTDGLTALVTDATVVVESTFGFDQNPDSFFRIINTGQAGTTWTLDIAGTANDPSTPDRDLPAYQKIFTVQVSEEGDEEAFRDRIIQELNQDSTFKNTVYFKAQRSTDRAIVHIYSTKFSASGEFYERPNPGDFDVTIGGTPGDGQVVIGFDNVISRSKPVTIARDADSPHRLGLFGITGNVSVVAKELADIFIQNATDDGTPTGNNDLRVGNPVSPGSPAEFYINSVIEKDIFIEQMIFHAQGNGIKFGNFLSQNSALDDPIIVEIKSDNNVTTFPEIYTTEDFKNEFAALSGNGANFRIDVQAGADEMLAILTFANPFVIRASGTFTTDDYIKIIIQDNTLQSIARFEFEVKGFQREA
jgi:hypothetical protein